MGWVNDVFTINAANANSGHRPIEWDIADHECRGSANHAKYIRFVLEVEAVHRCNHLRVIAPTFGEEWPARAVHQARREDFLVGRPAFSTEEATRDLAGRSMLLAVLTGERQKVNVRLRLWRSNCGNKHHGVCIAHHD